MGSALLVYSANNVGVNAANFDLTAATDPDFTQRNGHYTFTEGYKLACMAAVGASITRGRYQSPTINALGEFATFTANRAATVPSNPFVEMYLPNPLPLPINEEFQVQTSNNLASSTEQETYGLWILSNDWTANLPAAAPTPFNYNARFRCTVTVTPTVNAWSGPQPISLSASLRNGVWAMVGGYCQGTNAAFWRVVFPKYKLYQGRKLRPGGIVQNAVGDVPAFNWHFDGRWLGEWGRFHTFELPQIDIFGLTASSTTYQIWLDLIYLGTDLSLLSGGLGAS